MRQSVIAERVCLISHILAKVFGLVGIMLVIPNAKMILNFGDVGQTAMQVSMANGGVVDIIFGIVAVSIYACRVLGWRTWLGFLIPSVLISVGSELLGTSTGFPFGDYSYLSGLGYKIGGLVPFTIPLSWFYVGLSAYLIARSGLKVAEKPTLIRHIGAIAIGALLFTSWDFALEPAMSQTAFPFWYWETPGDFFGTPYRNYAGWFGTSALFMSLAALIWGTKPIKLWRSQLVLPLIVYLSNFGFAAGLSLGDGYVIPVSLGFVLGVIPALVLWLKSSTVPTYTVDDVENAANEVAVASLKVAVK
ncbi:putative membrane protein [Rivularia sp. PCC 7116]|uniref:gamma-carotene 1'-hydroxylase CruF n=1 Tax=Rivularia sp. PCC 7116 TaxID=373994 RepID=UPI00029EC5CD|nr:carotenoid biosynthesis protein [Rivularia sp. PCC 7116]AFY56955.1 putative membrane protein [Rivularia sp. PCC 7116]